MKIESLNSDWVSTPCEALILSVDENWNGREDLRRLNEATGDWLFGILKRGDVPTKPHRVTLLHAPSTAPAPLIALVGTGARGKVPADIPFRASASAIRAVMTRNRSIVRVVGLAASPQEERAVVAGAISACLGQDLCRSEKSTFAPEHLQFAGY
ncbi:MAG: M17 family peptidase N-terminal domain-containing protein, partial [Planctomycetota bacterium]